MGGIWKHRLTNIDPIAKIATCSHCGIVPVRARATKNGIGYRCSVGNRANRTTERLTEWKKKSYRAHKGTVCEVCGFVAVHQCQMDVHHKDGDHNNNIASNLETLCANCHRLKHFA